MLQAGKLHALCSGGFAQDILTSTGYILSAREVFPSANLCA